MCSKCVQISISKNETVFCLLQSTENIFCADIRVTQTDKGKLLSSKSESPALARTRRILIKTPVILSTGTETYIPITATVPQEKDKRKTIPPIPFDSYVAL